MSSLFIVEVSVLNFLTRSLVVKYIILFSSWCRNLFSPSLGA